MYVRTDIFFLSRLLDHRAIKNTKCSICNNYFQIFSLFRQKKKKMFQVKSTFERERIIWFESLFFLMQKITHNVISIEQFTTHFKNFNFVTFIKKMINDEN